MAICDVGRGRDGFNAMDACMILMPTPISTHAHITNTSATHTPPHSYTLTRTPSHPQLRSAWHREDVVGQSRGHRVLGQLFVGQRTGAAEHVRGVMCEDVFVVLLLIMGSCHFGVFLFYCRVDILSIELGHHHNILFFSCLPPRLPLPPSPPPSLIVQVCGREREKRSQHFRGGARCPAMRALLRRTRLPLPGKCERENSPTLVILGIY